MLIAERQSLIQELLAQRGMSDLETLASELQVSLSTIRRDLEQLEHKGLVTRTHGGAIWIGDRDSPAEGKALAATRAPYAFDQRVDFQAEAKRRIARAARGLIKPGETILLDGGTTTFYLALELLGTSLQLVTNSLPIANLFLNDEHVELILTGGLMYPRYGVLLGPMAENSLSAIHVKTLFLSVAGVHEGALYNQNLLLVHAERRMMAQAQRVVLLVDSGKFGQQALAGLGELSEIDTVVVDSELSGDFRDQVTRAGCELIIAE
jgi:DeoR/GlpR family transcriptional regulator of sugar metabolism